MTTAQLDTRLAALDNEDGSLELLHQPEVDLATGAVVAVEGLAKGLLEQGRGWRGDVAPALRRSLFVPPP